MCQRTAVRTSLSVTVYPSAACAWCAFGRGARSGYGAGTTRGGPPRGRLASAVGPARVVRRIKYKSRVTAISVRGSKAFFPPMRTSFFRSGYRLRPRCVGPAAPAPGRGTGTISYRTRRPGALAARRAGARGSRRRRLSGLSGRAVERGGASSAPDTPPHSSRGRARSARAIRVRQARTPSQAPRARRSSVSSVRPLWDARVLAPRNRVAADAWAHPRETVYALAVAFPLVAPP